MLINEKFPATVLVIGQFMSTVRCPCARVGCETGGAHRGRSPTMVVRLHPVNDALDAALAGLMASGWSPELNERINAALGVPTGTARTAAAFPVVAYHVQAGAPGQAIVVFLLTPARLIRYEELGAESLTVAVPLSRVSQVIERMNSATRTLSVTLELDAGARVLTLGYEEAAQEPGTAGRAEGRSMPTTYDLQATSNTPADTNDMWSLWAFSRAVRSAIGM